MLTSMTPSLSNTKSIAALAAVLDKLRNIELTGSSPAKALHDIAGLAWMN